VRAVQRRGNALGTMGTHAKVELATAAAYEEPFQLVPEIESGLPALFPILFQAAPDYVIQRRGDGSAHLGDRHRIVLQDRRHQ
jgi:hypothetical protein